MTKPDPYCRTVLRWCCWLALLIGPPMAAQDGSGQQAPLFRSRTVLVKVDVVVTDSKGNPVRGLEQDAFEIIERGRSQAIQSFEFIDLPRQSGSREPLLPRGVVPDSASNIASSSGRAFVVLIDDLHLLEDHLLKIKQIVTDFINAMRPEDEVAIVFVSRSDLSLNFTSDRSVLLRATDGIKDALGFGVDAQGRTSNSGLTIDPRVVSRAGTAANATLLNVLRALEGADHSRKAILHVTNGSLRAPTSANRSRFGADPDEVREIFAASRRANVPIYSIDPRGAALPADAVRGGIGAIGDIDSEPGPQQFRSIAQNIRQQQERLKEFAVNTGALAFAPHSDLSDAVNRVVADNSGYYLLGYTPNPAPDDGGYHPIQVKVQGRNLRVRARLGYVAPGGEVTGTDPAELLNRAVRNAVNVSGVGLRVAATPLLPDPNGTLTAVTVEISYPDRASAERFADNLAWSIVAVTPDGKIRGAVQKQANLSGNPAPGAFSVLVNDLISLPPEPLVLRVGVFSGALAKAGTVQLSIDVPDLAKGTLGLSAPSLGPFSEEGLNAGPILSVLPFQPTPRRQFGRSAPLGVSGLVFWRGAEPPTIRMSLRGVEGSDQSVEVRSREPNGEFLSGVYEGAIHLAELPPGHYVLDVVATRGRERVTRSLPFSVSQPG